jgi:hypothetical protein
MAVGRPPDKGDGRPDQAAVYQLDADESSSLVSVSTVHQATPYDVLDAAYGAATVELLREVRPDLPVPLIRSLAVELLDQASRDAAWLERRASTDPAVTRASTNRHVGDPYHARHDRELVYAAPRPGDYTGRRGQVD